MKTLALKTKILWRSLKASRAGTAVIEFALSFPTLVIVTLIIFDIGRAMFIWTTVNNVAAEGARYISVRGSGAAYEGTESGFINFIEDRATGLDTGSLDIDITYNPGNVTGGEVTVELSYPVEFFVSRFFTADGITITGVAKMTLL